MAYNSAVRIAVFSTKPYDRQFLDAAGRDTGHELTYFEPRLDIETAPLASGNSCVCAFVYEEEADLFFEDLSNTVIQDDVFARLLTFPNVIVTGHQGFFTQEAITAIAVTTMENIGQFEANGICENVVAAATVRGR